MARKSRIKRELPADVLSELNAQIADGRRTVDELTAWLAERGHPMPRSNVHRYAQEVEEVAREIRETKEIATSLFASTPAGDDGAMQQQLTEMLHVVLHKGFRALVKEENPAISPEDLHFLARTIKDLSAAQKTSVDRMLNAAKLQAAKEALKKAATAAEGAARKAGMTKETVAQIRHAVLGVEQ